MPPKIKKVGNYELGVTLGQGAFGKVKICSCNENGVTKSYAMKLMDKNKIRQAGLGAQIKKEIRVMKTLHHPSCIKLIEVLASKTTIFLVLELVTGGELFDRIVADGKFAQEDARKYFIQLIEGLEHCHSLGICHRDLKPENLLLDARGNLKITDFGLSSYNEFKEDPFILHTACGTPNYVAPEVLMEKGYDGEAADIWSAGVILYVLLAGFLPFDEAQMVDLFRKIVCADFQYPSWISQEAQQLISRMLEPDPERRAKMDEIKNSLFVRGDSGDQTEYDGESNTNPKLGTRKLSQFFNQEEMLAEVNSTPTSKTYPQELINSPIESIDYTNHTVRLQGQDIPILDWFCSKYPGRRSVAVQKRRKSSKRRASNPSLMISQISPTPSMASPTPEGTPSAVITVTTAPSTTTNTKSDTNTNTNTNTPTTTTTSTSTTLPSDLPPPTLQNAMSSITEDAEQQQDDEEEEPTGPKPLNAFDLINMVSGQSMNNMLLFNRNNTPQATGQGQQPNFTQFTSRLSTDELMARIDYVLLQTPKVRYRINTPKCQISLVWNSAKNHRIAAHIEVYALTPFLHMVQCKRMHGSILAHHEFFKKLRDEVKANETNVALDTVKSYIDSWERDYPIFAQTYQQLKNNLTCTQQNPCTEITVDECCAPASSSGGTPTSTAGHMSSLGHLPVVRGSIHGHGSVHGRSLHAPAGRGIDTMRSLTTRAPVAPHVADSSSSEDEDEDEDSTTDDEQLTKLKNLKIGNLITPSSGPSA